MVTLGQRIKMNIILNALDPFKDMAASYTLVMTLSHQREVKRKSRLSAELSSDILSTIIQPLFFPDFIPIPDLFTEGCRINESHVRDSLKEIVTTKSSFLKPFIDHTTAYRILTAKDKIHMEQSIGGDRVYIHDLHVSFDAGRGDIVESPIYVITPGSIFDPACRATPQTKGMDVRVVDTIFWALPLKYIQQLGLDTLITDEIHMTDTKETYIITIPTKKIGEIKCSFDKQSLNVIPPPDYCEGNAIKNAFIARNSTNKVECSKYILCKELGDTLQVIWIRYLLDKFREAGNPRIKEDTIVITTNDDTVLYRALVNEVPVIHTSVDGIWYYHTSEINRNSSLLAWIPETLDRLNKRVIYNIKSILLSPFHETYWVDGKDWTNVLYIENAKRYIRQIITFLSEKNREIIVYLENIRTHRYISNIEGNLRMRVAAMMKLFEQYHFNDIVTGTHIGDGTIYCKLVDRKVNIINTNVNTVFDPTKFVWQNFTQSVGGKRGGFSSVRKTSSSNKMNIPHNVFIIATPEDIEWENQFFEVNQDTPHFLYLYTRDFHGEVFTYAAAIKSVAINGTPEGEVFETLRKLCEDSCEFELGKRYALRYSEQQKGDFEVYEGAERYDEKETFTKALFSIFLVGELLNRFPAFRSRTLCAFLEVVRQRYVEDITQFTWFHCVETNNILDSAMSNYAVYYRKMLDTMFTNHTVSEEEFLHDLVPVSSDTTDTPDIFQYIEAHNREKRQNVRKNTRRNRQNVLSVRGNRFTRRHVRDPVLVNAIV